ncbi:MAG: Dot/Icm secretion system ATPase DotB [Legionellales bacterium]|nr:Dot/Icm secretion system ATPase DotB [Legionellales bacterium]|tara:strand:+ start:14813 stop:15952 length:1140 start_codon:yes stop_codon:yes gene_type:complete
MTDEHLLPNEPQRFTVHELDKMVVYCYQLDASDITLQTNEPVFAEVHGRLVPITKRKLSNTEVGEMLNAIYGPNGTTQILSGRDVDTHYEVRPSRTERYRYRVNGTGCLVDGHDGIQITLRTIPSDPPPLTALNLEEDIFNSIMPEEGVVYITGATGSGKSTLLASVIRHIIEQEDCHRKVLTYESPIEFVFDNIAKVSAVVSQSEIPRHLPSFAAGVRNALRRKPRLILVGEARDAETISAAMEAALTGHPVYTTLHSNGVAEVMRRLVTTYPAEERHGRTIDIIETARLVVWQKLVATPDGKRTPLREYLVFDDEVRDILLETDPESITGATRRLVKERGQPIEVDAKRKLDAGIISEREYKLVTLSSRNADRDAGL